jgi:hypothetical protein
MQSLKAYNNILGRSESFWAKGEATITKYITKYITPKQFTNLHKKAENHY